MTELEVPPETDDQTISELVREFVDLGDEVEVWEAERTTTGGGPPVLARGVVTGFETGYLEIDGEPLNGESVRYEQIHTMSRVDSPE